jgi:hypothetical protein
VVETNVLVHAGYLAEAVLTTWDMAHYYRYSGVQFKVNGKQHRSADPACAMLLPRLASHSSKTRLV